MEIPAWLFFSFWALISITFLHLGFYSLDKTELSTSVSPVVLSLFKHSLAIFSCCSSSHALIFRPQSTDHVLKPYVWVAWGIFSFLYRRVFEWTFLWGILLSGLTLYALVRVLAWLIGFLDKSELGGYSLITVSWGTLLRLLISTFLLLPASYFPSFITIFTMINFLLVAGDNSLEFQVKIQIGIHMALETSLFFVSGEKGNTEFFPILVMLLSFSISAFWAVLSGFDPLSRVYAYPSLGREFFNAFLPADVRGIFSSLKEKKMGKLITFAGGMLGTVFFQNFFRLTTFDHVVAFLYLAVMWVANLSLLGVSGDLGVFNFLLGNVVVGCTVNQFGLRATTWLAYGTCLLLYGLRLKLESLNLVCRHGQHIQVTLWSDSSLSLLPT